MPQDWTYRQHGGLNYDATPGSTWRVGDAATLTVGNLAVLPPLPPSALAYADPPWNQGNRNAFHTKARREHASDPFPVFLRQLLDSIAQADAWVIEMGRQNASILDALIQKRGRVPSEYDTTYYHRHPAKLFTGLKKDARPRTDPSGLDDDDTPAWAISEYTQPGDLIVDPVTGRGLTAIAALTLGRRFHGYELSQHRSSVTLTRLAALTGATPERIT